MAEDAGDVTTRVSVDQAFAKFVQDHRDVLDDPPSWRGVVSPRHRPTLRLDLQAVFRKAGEKGDPLASQVWTAWHRLAHHLLSPEVAAVFEASHQRERERLAPALELAGKLHCAHLVETDPNVAAFFLALAESFRDDGLPSADEMLRALPTADAAAAAAGSFSGGVQDLILQAQSNPSFSSFVGQLFKKLKTMRSSPGMVEASHKIFAALKESPHLPPEAANLLRGFPRP